MKNYLIYRNNSLWMTLEEDLLIHASFYGGSPGKPDVQGAVVEKKVFSPETTAEEIAQWLIEHKEEILSSETLYADNTVITAAFCAGINKGRCWKRNLDDHFRNVADDLFKGKSPTETYRKVFIYLVEKVRISRFQIVLQNLTDYNPLVIEGFDSYEVGKDIEKLHAYAGEFKKLIPASTVVEFTDIKDVALPDKNTVVIGHHHALNTRGDIASLYHDCPRVLMPYPYGLLEKAGKLCDISQIVTEDFLPEMRKRLRREK